MRYDKRELLNSLQRLHDDQCTTDCFNPCKDRPYNSKKCEGCGIDNIFKRNNFKPKLEVSE